MVVLDIGKFAISSREMQWFQLSDPMRNLVKLFTFRNVKAILDFMREHPFSVNLLQEAYTAIEQSFGPNPEVLLEVVADPEVPGRVQMFGYIVSGLPPEEAGERLRQFDRDWFLKQLPRIKGLLNFDVEFV